MSLQKKNKSERAAAESKTHLPDPIGAQQAWIKNELREIPIYEWSELKSGAQISGPALLVNDFTSLLIEPQWIFRS